MNTQYNDLPPLPPTTYVCGIEGAWSDYPEAFDSVLREAELGIKEAKR